MNDTLPAHRGVPALAAPKESVRSRASWDRRWIFSVGRRRFKMKNSDRTCERGWGRGRRLPTRFPSPKCFLIINNRHSRPHRPTGPSAVRPRVPTPQAPPVLRRQNQELRTGPSSQWPRAWEPGFRYFRWPAAPAVTARLTDTQTRRHVCSRSWS